MRFFEKYFQNLVFIRLPDGSKFIPKFASNEEELINKARPYGLNLIISLIVCLLVV